MKKMIALLLSLLFLMICPALAESLQAAEPAGEAAQEGLAGYIIVLHTGDTLGRAEENLGFVCVGEARARFEAEGAAVLLLDDGGVLPDDEALTADEALAQAGSIARIMTEAGYDAMTPAPADFARGLEGLTALRGAAGFPLLSVNAQDAEGARLMSGSIIVEKDGLRIGVFGVTGPLEAEGVEIADAAKAAASSVSTLRGEGCDVVIALARLGADESGTPAAAAFAEAAPGIDILIDMSAGAPVEGLWTEGGTLIVSSPAGLAGIGVVAIDPAGLCAAMVMDESWF